MRVTRSPARGGARPSSEAVSARMQAQARKDTTPELALRSLLHRQGLRFRVHARPIASLRREADIVFRRARVAVFVNGCFWHGCEQHATWPKANARWWKEKIEANRRRDRETDAELDESGWLAIRIWEHDDPHVAAGIIAAAVEHRSSG